MTRNALRILRALMMLFAVTALAAGPVYFINQLTQIRGIVDVPVRVTAQSPNAVSAAGQGDFVLGTFDDASYIAVDPAGASLHATGSTWPEQTLSGATTLIALLALGLGLLLTRSLVAKIGSGTPFARGNARKLATLAVLIAVGGSLSALFSDAASLVTLQRTGDTFGDYVLSPSLTVDPVPLVVAAFLLCLSVAFRQGERLQKEVDSLI